MTEPATFDEKITPFITLGGRKWPVPRPVWKQMRLIRDPIYALSDAITQNGTVSELLYRELPPEEYDRMAMVVRVALTRAHPTLTEDEFNEIEIGEFELLNAFLVIRLQTGQYVPMPAGGAEPLGEAGGGTANSISTAHSGESSVTTAERLSTGTNG